MTCKLRVTPSANPKNTELRATILQNINADIETFSNTQVLENYFGCWSIVRVGPQFSAYFKLLGPRKLLWSLSIVRVGLQFSTCFKLPGPRKLLGCYYC